MSMTMTLYPRSLHELQHAPYMATLPALSACIQAVCSALDIEHPDLLSRPPTTCLDTLALALRCHLDECHQILRDYDELLFDCYFWSDGATHDPLDDPDRPDEPESDDDDDIPF